MAPLSTNPSLLQFRALLKRMPPAIAKQAKAAVGVEVRKLAAAMRAAAPVSEDQSPGQLKRSVRVSVTGKLAVTIRAGGRLTTTPSGYDYSLAVEYGNEHASAQPFFWPTYRARRAGVIAAIHTAFRTALKQAWNVQ